MYHPRRHTSTHAEPGERQIDNEERTECPEDAYKDRKPEAAEGVGAVVSPLDYVEMFDARCVLLFMSALAPKAGY